MKIGLLVCDHARTEFISSDGSYPEMFRRLLPDFDFTDYYVCDGLFPGSPDDQEGWIISGSRRSVYDDIEWIYRLRDFTSRIYHSGRPCIGVCFGHQMIGAALGGTVRKAETGWCVGIHELEFVAVAPWLNPKLKRANLRMMCQDQVISLPQDSTLIARSAYIPNAVMQVGSNMLGIQGHPEFSSDFEYQLIHVNARHLKPGQAEKGIESLQQIAHNEDIGGIMKSFLLMC